MKNSKTLEVTNDVILRVKPEGSGMLKRFFAPLRMTKPAFTLAEVLITLAIIGVVASLTIPNIIQNYQERSWNIASSNFERIFGEALKTMNVQSNLSGLQTTEKFVNELQKYMKITKICDNTELSDCFPSIEATYSIFDVSSRKDENYISKLDSLNSISTSKGLGQPTWETNSVGLQFANGVTAIVSYNPNCSANPFDNDSVKIGGTKEKVTFTTDCVAMMYDVNAFSSPNQMNKDVRITNQTALKNQCNFLINGKCAVSKGYINRYLTKNECDDLMADGKISSCYYTYAGEKAKDYWAGAVATCGGIQKMPDQAQLQKVVDYLYETGSPDKTKATALGITFKENGTTCIFTNSGSSASAQRVCFNNTPNWSSNQRVDDHQTICIND